MSGVGLTCEAVAEVGAGSPTQTAPGRHCGSSTEAPGLPRRGRLRLGRPASPGLCSPPRRLPRGAPRPGRSRTRRRYLRVGRPSAARGRRRGRPQARARWMASRPCSRRPPLLDPSCPRATLLSANASRSTPKCPPRSAGPERTIGPRHRPSLSGPLAPEAFLLFGHVCGVPDDEEEVDLRLRLDPPAVRERHTARGARTSFVAPRRARHREDGEQRESSAHRATLAKNTRKDESPLLGSGGASSSPRRRPPRTGPAGRRSTSRGVGNRVDFRVGAGLGDCDGVVFRLGAGLGDWKRVDMRLGASLEDR